MVDSVEFPDVARRAIQVSTGIDDPMLCSLNTIEISGMVWNDYMGTGTLDIGESGTGVLGIYANVYSGTTLI
jgi:hypothetical protein